MSPRQSALVFSANCFIAAMLALWVGFSFGLPRPYWAMLTVYITAQPQTGALRSKAFYRVIGTSVGGMAAVALVPNLVNSPTLLSVAIAGWTGLCLYLSLLDRTPRAYVFMLAGYTTAIIGFPSVGAPQAIFETALARVEEITLGILCATLVHTVVLPSDVGKALSARVGAFLRDAQRWTGDALSGRRGGEERAERRRLASDITELHVISSHLPFDTANRPTRINTVRTLESRLAYTLPLISALEDRLDQLGERSEPLSRLIEDIVAWAEDGGADADEQDSRAEALRQRAAGLMPALEPGSVDWRGLLTVSILIRLDELIQALQDSRHLARMIGGGTDPVPERLAALLKMPRRRRLHLDHGMAALSGLSLMAAVLACCTLWIGLGWSDGAVAALSAAIFSSFYATLDDPAPAIAKLLVWLLISLPLAALYLFAVLPAIDGFPMLVLALAPVMLLIGYMQARPRWASPGIALLIGFAGALALQPTFSADLPEFVNGNLAQIVGIVLAMACARLLRSVGAGWAARRILKTGWRDVSALARRRRNSDPDAWIALMLDRVGLISARVALSGPEDSVDASDALADLRVGINILDLRAAADEVGPAHAASLERIMETVAAAYDARARAQTTPAAPQLLADIDRAIDDLANGPAPVACRRGFAALAGLRRNLFPDAAAYVPGSVRAA